MRIAVLATAVCLSIVGLSAASDVEAAARRPTSIPAQGLAPALQILARDRDFQVVYRSEVVGELRTQGASGELTADEALRQLLSGTGLTFSYLDDKTVTITPTASSAPTATDAQETPSVPQASGNPVTPNSGTVRKPSWLERFRLAQNEPSSQTDSPSSSNENPSQGSDKNSEGRVIDEVVVTGSRIQRTGTEGPSPVIVFKREDIERTGATSLQQLFNYVTQASTNNDATGLAVFAGATTVRLRGLPTGTTLVLINGRRTVVSGALFTANIFNLNNIPLAAVERMEVLTDSASAVYGADALAGVVNVILRKGVTDSEFDYRYGSAADGGTQSNRASFTTGFDSSQLKVTAFIEGFKQTPLSGTEIDRIANADYRGFGGPDRRGGFAVPGNVYAVPGTGNLPGLPSTFAAIPGGQPGTGLTPASFLPTAGTRNLGPNSGLGEYDFVFDVERYSALARVDYEPGETVRFFGEALFNDSREINSIANLLSRSFSGLVPSTNPFNPFGANVQVDVLLQELPVSRIFDSRYLRLLLGAAGSLGTWDWELGLLGTRDETTERDTNLLDSAVNGRLTAALRDPNPATALNPFVGGSIPASRLTGLLRNDLLLNLESRADQADLQFRGPLGVLPAGPVEWAVGGEARKERLLSNSPSGDRPTFDQNRSVRSGFAEVLVPILGESVKAPFAQRVALTAAVRYDRYSDFGSATSPQFGLVWTLAPQAMLRVSRGEAFRPPSLRQLGAPVPLNFGITDPRRGNEQYVTPGTSGGNPDLEPESGTSTNVGLVFTPFSNDSLVVSADAWRVNLTERILQLSTTATLANEALFPELVTRAPASPADQAQGLPGRVIFLRGVFANFGQAKVEGVDLRLTSRSKLFDGTLTNTLSATYVSKYDAAILPGQPLQGRAGVAVADGYAPRIKASWSGSWTHGGWEISPGLRYVHSYQDYATPPLGPRTVASSTLVDFAVGYTWPESAGAILGGAKLALNVINALDEEPPYSNSSIGYDSLQGDVLGRQLYLNLRKRF